MISTIGKRHFPLKNKGREWKMFIEDKEKTVKRVRLKIEEIKEGSSWR